MNENKKSKTREKKEALVAKISDKIKKAKEIVFVNYQGMTHRQLEDLKKALKKTDAELSITKNSLLLRSLEIGNWKLPASPRGEEIGNSIEGPTATLFAYQDVIAPLKELAKIIKSLNLPVIKFGILDKKSLTAEEILKLAALPPREVLLAQLVGGLKSPIFGLHRALSWNIQKLVMTLKAVEESKSASSKLASSV